MVEINPNYNDAKKFANRHSGRVFICDSFGTMAEGMIQWGDAPKMDHSDRRTSEDYVALEELLQPTMDEIDAIASRGGVSLAMILTGGCCRACAEA